MRLAFPIACLLTTIACGSPEESERSLEFPLACVSGVSWSGVLPDQQSAAEVRLEACLNATCLEQTLAVCDGEGCKVHTLRSAGFVMEAGAVRQAEGLSVGANLFLDSGDSSVLEDGDEAVLRVRDTGGDAVLTRRERVTYVMSDAPQGCKLAQLAL